MVTRRDADRSSVADTEGLTVHDITAGSRLLSHAELCRLHAKAVLPKRGGGRGVILDQAAFDAIVLANVRLVAKPASKLSHMLACGHRIAFDDLFNVGILGLMEGVLRFNPAKGNQFSTYATWWIRQKTRRATEDQGSAVRLPNYQHAHMRRMFRAESRLWVDLERAPTNQELAAALGITVERLVELKGGYGLTEEPFPLGEPPSVASPGAPGRRYRDDEQATLGDLLADPDELNQPGSDAHIEKVSRREMLDGAIAHAGLTVREGAIIAYRFGFLDGREWTLEELGKKLNVTRERIRQIEKGALQKLARGARMAGYGPAELHLVVPDREKKTTAKVAKVMGGGRKEKAAS